MAETSDDLKLKSPEVDAAMGCTGEGKETANVNTSIEAGEVSGEVTVEGRVVGAKKSA